MPLFIIWVFNTVSEHQHFREFILENAALDYFASRYNENTTWKFLRESVLKITESPNIAKEGKAGNTYSSSCFFTNSEKKPFAHHIPPSILKPEAQEARLCKDPWTVWIRWNAYSQLAVGRYMGIITGRTMNMRHIYKISPSFLKIQKSQASIPQIISHNLLHQCAKSTADFYLVGLTISILILIFLLVKLLMGWGKGLTLCKVISLSKQKLPPKVTI